MPPEAGFSLSPHLSSPAFLWSNPAGPGSRGHVVGRGQHRDTKQNRGVHKVGERQPGTAQLTAPLSSSDVWGSVSLLAK